MADLTGAFLLVVSLTVGIVSLLIVHKRGL
jgi:hypothetical protein